MKINKIEQINTTLYNILSEITNVETHYISPSETTKFPYLAFRYEKLEEFMYILTIETWSKNEDLVFLENILEILISELDKKLIFKDKISFRFYYSNKGEIELIEGSDIIGREINFEMKII